MNLEMLKRAKANVDAKLAKKAQADAKKALNSDVDLMTEETKTALLSDIAAMENKPVVTATTPPVVPVVTVLPGPVATVEETATGKAAANRRAKSAEKTAGNAEAVLTARNIKHGARIETPEELEKELKKGGVIVVYCGNIAAGVLNADWQQCYRATYLPTALFPTLVLEFLHDGQQRGKKDNFKNSSFTLNRELLESDRMYFARGWRASTCYKLA